MSRSFFIDLNPFPLCRPIGVDEKILQGTIGAYEVCQLLNDLGYNNLDEYPELLPYRFGMIPTLNDVLTAATLGIPTTAQINIKRVGGNLSRLLLTFTY